MHFPSVIALLTALPSVLACEGYNGGLPKHTGTKTLGSPQYIKKGQTFDAGWVKYDRGVKCTGQAEGGEKDTVFVLEDGAKLRNGGGTANIIGGGAYKAADKIIQHNGCGHVNIINFYANDYGKVYRSCGNCKGNCRRSVRMEGTTAVNGGELMGINTNLGDKATCSNNCYPKVQCQGYNGCDKGNGACEPTKAGLC
ncbi:pectate lyase [Fusarium bulbicola]|nr:pectate lyase [Fusarium bulbicola]